MCRVVPVVAVARLAGLGRLQKQGLGVASASGGGGLRLVCTLGGAGSSAPLQFIDGTWRSPLPPPPPVAAAAAVPTPLLLFTDAGHDVVHLVDVVGGTHAGYLASPGVHRRAPWHGGEWGLAPGGRQRVEEARQR